MSEGKNLNGLVNSPTRRQMIAGVALTVGAVTLGSTKAWAGADAGDEISRIAESIHLEHVFKASRKRVYDALTDAKQFDRVVMLSDAMKSGMAPGMKPVEMSREAGGAFAAFGGYVTGRQIELVPNERIVQAWRAGSWKEGDYSIVKFQLVEEGAGTKLVFDHSGFPKGEAEHLVQGWKMNYWAPVEKFLALNG